MIIRIHFFSQFSFAAYFINTYNTSLYNTTSHNPIIIQRHLYRDYSFWYASTLSTPPQTPPCILNSFIRSPYSIDGCIKRNRTNCLIALFQILSWRVSLDFFLLLRLFIFVVASNRNIAIRIDGLIYSFCKLFNDVVASEKKNPLYSLPLHIPSTPKHIDSHTQHSTSHNHIQNLFVNIIDVKLHKANKEIISIL